jgi:hypothetical protein
MRDGCEAGTVFVRTTARVYGSKRRKVLLLYCQDKTSRCLVQTRSGRTISIYVGKPTRRISREEAKNDPADSPEAAKNDLAKTDPRRPRNSKRHCYNHAKSNTYCYVSGVYPYRSQRRSLHILLQAIHPPNGGTAYLTLLKVASHTETTHVCRSARSSVEFLKSYGKTGTMVVDKGRTGIAKSPGDLKIPGD